MFISMMKLYTKSFGEFVETGHQKCIILRKDLDCCSVKCNIMTKT